MGAREVSGDPKAQKGMGNSGCVIDGCPFGLGKQEETLMSLCKCGCGDETKKGNFYIHGHQLRNIKYRKPRGPNKTCTNLAHQKQIDEMNRQIALLKAKITENSYRWDEQIDKNNTMCRQINCIDKQIAHILKILTSEKTVRIKFQ